MPVGAMHEMLEAGRIMGNGSPAEGDLWIILHSSAINVELWTILLSSVLPQNNK